MHNELLPHQASTQGFLETPTLKYWHQLDLILVRRAIKNVLHTRSHHSAECDTDHSLVCCKIRMQPKKFHRTKTKVIPRINVSKMSLTDLMEQFTHTFEKEFGTSQPGDSAIEKWEALRDTMYGTALATFWKKFSKSHDWFKARSTVMIPSLKPSELLSQNTNAHPVRGTYRFSGLPGARLRRLLGAAQTNTGQDSARTSSLPP